MVKEIGNITLFSAKDLHEALGINERTIRQWFKSGRLKGQKIGTAWHTTEKNLELFLSGDEGAVNKAIKKRKTTKRKGVKKK